MYDDEIPTVSKKYPIYEGAIVNDVKEGESYDIC